MKATKEQYPCMTFDQVVSFYISHIITIKFKFIYLPQFDSIIPSYTIGRIEAKKFIAAADVRKIFYAIRTYF